MRLAKCDGLNRAGYDTTQATSEGVSAFCRSALYLRSSASLALLASICCRRLSVDDMMVESRNEFHVRVI